MCAGVGAGVGVGMFGWFERGVNVITQLWSEEDYVFMASFFFPFFFFAIVAYHCLEKLLLFACVIKKKLRMYKCYWKVFI